ncbi:hypothetical protein E4U52_002293 [Claviceps spartinae]|nr:hypothetical protein E4U52_002293 [Claviceps spartinae]
MPLIRTPPTAAITTPPTPEPIPSMTPPKPTTAPPKLPLIFGYSLDDLEQEIRDSIMYYATHGAVKKVGPIEKVENLPSLDRTKDNLSPVHTSHFNPRDREEVISVRICPMPAR